MDHVLGIDVVMSMYNLIEYSDNCSQTTGSLWQYYRDKPALNNNDIIVDFPDDNNSASFKFKQRITGQIRNHDTKDVQIVAPLKYLTSFWKTLEMSLINYEISPFLTWSRNYSIVAGTPENQEPRFAITETKLYVSV